MTFTLSFFQLLMLIGFPTLFLCFLGFLASKIKKLGEENEAVQLGVQALLRDRLYKLYNTYQGRGYAPLYAKENFKNMYIHYHKLGENGVMDTLYEKFMALPEIEKEEDKYVY